MVKSLNTITGRARVGLQGMRRDERGAALITTLVFLVMLTMLGLAAVMTSDTEVMLSRNYRVNILALDYANAGVQEALARMDMEAGPPAPLGDFATKTTAITDPTQQWPFSFEDSGADLGFIQYSGVVKYRREDALHWRGSGDTPQTGTKDDLEVVGYSKDCGYSQSPVSNVINSLPVYEITSTGRVMSGAQAIASATVKVEVTRNALNINVDSPLRSNGCINAAGTVDLAGASNCPDKPDLPAYKTPCMSGVTAGTPTVSPPGEDGGDGIAPVDMTSADNFLGMPLPEIQKLAQADGTYYELLSSTPDVWSGGKAPFTAPYENGYGDTVNDEDPKIVYIKLPPGEEYSMPTNTSSFGIFIVEGSLRTAGNTYFEGLVYVTEDFTSSTGTVNIDGGLMAGGSADTQLGGTISISYDCQALEDVAKKAFRSRIINWQRLYN